MSPEDLIKRYNIRWFYHFTDESNVGAIIKRKGLYSLELLEGFKIVPKRPGGDELSRNLDVKKRMNHYVHLSFTKDHPMKFVAEEQGRIGPIRVLRIESSVLKRPRVRITPDVANKRDVPVYSVGESANHIDYEVIYDYMDWNDPQIQERRRQAKRAEILVPVMVSAELIDFNFNG